MDDGLPEINDPSGRIEITEADLGPVAIPNPPARSPVPPPPPQPLPRPPAPHAVEGAPRQVSPAPATAPRPVSPAPATAPRPVSPAPATAPRSVSAAPTATRPFAPLAEGGVPDRDWTEATRLMCAAAYLEGTFAQNVVDEIIHERHRAVQIPTGVDIATVAKHCLAACRQKIVRDLLLTADLLLAIALFITKGSLSWLFFGFLLAWAIVLWDVWSATYLVVVRRLNPQSFSSHTAPVPSDPHLARRIDELARNQRGNLTVYSGFLPFSGAGLDVGGWSFLLDLRKGKEDVFGDRSTANAPIPGELYEGVAQSLSALEMPNLEIRDRLFVSGSDVRDDRRLMPDPLGPPPSWVDPNVVGHYMVSPTHQIRHYRCIEIIDWRGELVVSLFLRFAISNERLFCELNKFVLVPLKEELHRLNHFGGGVRPRHVASMVFRSCIATPGLSFRAPQVVVRPLIRILEQSSKAKDVAKDPFFDYGAPETTLDRVRSNKYRRYFQRLDKEMYDKVLERTVLDSIVEVLDQHGVNTAEIAERRATIINNGIMMGHQSSLDAKNIALGGGRINIHIPRPGGGGGGGGGGTPPGQHQP
jgi:hypothetical protein